MKEYSYSSPYGGTCTIRLSKASYAHNGNLAVHAEYYDKEFNAWLPYGNVTVNLGNKLPAQYAYVDENNFLGVLDWLVSNGIAEFTGKYGYSGFCQYPLVKFNESAF